MLTRQLHDSSQSEQRLQHFSSGLEAVLGAAMGPEVQGAIAAHRPAQRETAAEAASVDEGNGCDAAALEQQVKVWLGKAAEMQAMPGKLQHALVSTA